MWGPTPLRVLHAPLCLDLRRHGFPRLPLAPSPHPRACRGGQQLPGATDGVHYNMYNTRYIFATSTENIYNIRPKQLKHLQYTSETLAKHLKTLESHCKRMQHLDLVCNIHIKHLHTYKTPKTLGTYACNMHAMQHLVILLKHTDETLELKHTSETIEALETYTCNMRI